MPDTTLAVGVNVAVRVKPVPLMLLSVPPLTTTSPALDTHTKLLPGSSLKLKVMFAVSPDFKVATSDVMLTVGAVVSTTNSGLLATSMDVMALVLPVLSFKVAPFKLSAFKAMATPSVSVWPMRMVVLNTKALVPEPDTYVACTVLLPITKANVGEPAVVLSVTASLKVTVALSVSAALSSLALASRGLATAPVALLKARLAMLGARVSRARLEDTPALPLLSAVS